MQAAIASALGSRSAAPLRRWTLRTYSVALVLGLGTLLAACGLGLLWNNLADNATHEAGAIGSATALVAAQAVDADIAARTANVLIMAEVTTNENLWGHWDQLRQRLETVQKRNPSVSWIGAADASGRIVVAAGNLALGTDVSQRSWFTEGLKGPHHGDVHEAQVLGRVLPPLPAGEPWRFVDISAPVKDASGQVVGVLAMHLSWPWLREVLQRSASTAPGRDVWLVGRDNIPRHGGVSGEPLRLESLSRAREGRSGWMVETWPDGVRYITAYAPNPGRMEFHGLGWTTLVRVPVGSLSPGEWRLWVGAVIAAALVVALLAAITWLAARIWLNPLAGFIRRLDRLEDGDAAPAMSVRLPHEFHELHHGIVRLVERLNAKEAQVRLALERLELSFQSVGSSFPGVLGTGRLVDGRLMLDYVSSGVERYLGVTPQRATSQTAAWTVRVHPDDLAAFNTGLAGLVAESEPMARQALRVQERDGSVRVLQSTVVLRDDGTDARVDWVALDTTDLLAARDAADRADRTKGEFLSVMSQEIRTPLTAIIGFSRVLEESLPDPGQLRQVRFIRETAEVLTRVLNDVLDLARVDAGRFTLDARAFRMADTIDSVRTLYRVVAAEKGLAFHVEVPRDMPDFVGDPLRLRQVLEHLVGNAMKFTPAGSVTLRVVVQKVQQMDGGYREARVVIRITDTGIGMGREQVSRIFGRFEQADRSIKYRFGGAGLGLAISQTLVQMMGGHIDVTSVEGSGSQFTLSLPLPIADTAAANAGARAPDEGSSDRSLLVLVADGLALNRIVLRSLLESRGHRVVDAADGHEALSKVRDLRPDLVLVDVDMPSLDGLQFTRRLRDDALAVRDTCVHGLLSRISRIDRTACLAAGMDGCLAKPVDVEGLGLVLQAAARRGSDRSEATT